MDIRIFIIINENDSKQLLEKLEALGDEESLKPILANIVKSARRITSAKDKKARR